jgi:hypothetical protein
MMQGYLLGFLICASGSFFLARSLKTSIAKVLPFYLLGFPLVVYLFALVNQLLLGYIVVIAASVILTLFALVKNRKNLSKELSLLRAPSFILICAVFLLLGIIDFGRSFHAWDDFMHWGPFAKEPYRNLELYNSENSLVEVHRDYPPIVTLYECFWEVVAGKYDDSLLFVALQFLQVSLFMPFIGKLKWQKTTKFKLKFAGLALALVLVPACFSLGDDYFFVTIMTDTVIGMLFAFLLANVFLTKKVDQKLIVKLLIASCFLVLVKQIAFVFIAIMVACLVVKIIATKQQKKIMYSAMAILMVLVPLFLSCLWSMRVKRLGIDGQFKISSLIQGIRGLVVSTVSGPEKWQYQTAINFVKSYVYDTDIILGLSYFKITLLFGAAMIFWAIKDKEKRKYIIAEAVMIILAATGYALLMMLLYMFCFGDVEGPALAGYTRYMGTFWYAILMLGFCIFLHKAKDLTRLPNLGLLAVLAFIVLSSASSIALTLLRNYDAKNYGGALKVIEASAKTDDKVYIVSQGSNGSHNVRLKYLLNPIRTNPTYDSAFSFGPDDDADVWTHYMSAREFLDNLEGYNYLYLYDIDGYFVNKYQELFKDSLASGQLYKIENGKFELVGSGR